MTRLAASACAILPVMASAWALPAACRVAEVAPSRDQPYMAHEPPVALIVVRV